MTDLKLKDWFEAFGVVAIVASLVFVGMEIRQSRQIAVMDQLGVLSEIQNGFRDMVADHADVWHRGCTGVELTDAEKVMFAQIFSRYTATTIITNMRGNIGLFQGSQRWVENYALNIHRFSALRVVFDSYRLSAWNHDQKVTVKSIGGGEGQFDNMIIARLEELQITEPDPKVDPMWCGRL